MCLLKNSTKSQFYIGFPRFFPQALLCGFSKLQLQTQATAQVGKSHSGRLGARLGARRVCLQKVSFWQYLQRLATPTRRITARQRSTVTCASKTPSKIDKNMLNLHFVREWHTFFWAQSQLKMKIRRFFPMFLLKNSAKSQFYPSFSKIFPTSLALWVF